MADPFWIGVLVAHLAYGVMFFAMGCRRNGVPTLVVSAIAILFWPVMVQHMIMRRPSPPEGKI